MSKNPVPTRMCLGCMERKPKSELVRIVRHSNGKAIIDQNHNLDGRGAYICLNSECIRKAEKKSKFSRALKGEVSGDIYAELIILAENG